jgi:hypothetical protein
MPPDTILSIMICQSCHFKLQAALFCSLPYLLYPKEQKDIPQIGVHIFYKHTSSNFANLSDPDKFIYCWYKSNVAKAISWIIRNYFSMYE